MLGSAVKNLGASLNAGADRLAAAPSRQTEDVMTSMSFDDFMTARETAAEAYVRGDGARVDALVFSRRECRLS
jgi:hypothetical protein